MKSLLRATLLLIGLVCFTTQTHAQKLEKKLIGKWILQSMEIDISQVTDLPEKAKEEIERGKENMKAQTEKLKNKAFFEFLKDGKMRVYSEEKGEEKGTWRLKDNIVYLTKDNDNDTQSFRVKFEGKILHLRLENPEMKGAAIVLKFQK